MMLTVVGQHVLTPATGEANTDPKEVPATAWQGSDAAPVPNNIQSTVAEVRSCELCGATQTPMWRRGPSGKGSVCNACGVRWASRRRGSRKPIDDSAVSHAKEFHTTEGDTTGGALEQYYCKYCGLTWPLNFFKNRQQFGAHCSNCSRKRKSRDTLPNATSSNDMATSPREMGTSPTGPFLPHLNLRAAMPMKMPHDVHFSHHRFSDYNADHDELEDMYPPAKKYRTLPSGGHASSSGNHHHHHSQHGHSHSGMDSGDETYCDSDSETVTSPYGPSANSLYRLLGAVENVLTEEREMATTLNQMQAVRAMIDSLDETRKTTLAHLEQSLLTRLDHIQHVVTPAQIVALIERQQQAASAAEAPLIQNPINSVAPSLPTEPTAVLNAPTSTTAPISEAPVQSNAMEGVLPMAANEPANPIPTESAPIIIEANASAMAITSESKPEAEVKEAEAPKPLIEKPKTPEAVLASNEDQRLLKSSILAVEKAEKHIEAAMGPHVEVTSPVEVPSVNLPAELEKAAHELIAVFTNATLLQMGSAADIEQFKNCFVHVLNQSKASINQDVAALFEALVSLKQRQTQLGLGTFIDHMQLRALSNDVHALKQRVVNSSRTVQAMFVQLVTQFSDQIEAAKRIYQENAGNQVRMLDEVVRTSLSPSLSREVDQLRSELLAHINCVHTNLAYLDSLVLNSE